MKTTVRGYSKSKEIGTVYTAIGPITAYEFVTTGEPFIVYTSPRLTSGSPGLTLSDVMSTIQFAKSPIVVNRETEKGMTPKDIVAKESRQILAEVQKGYEFQHTENAFSPLIKQNVLKELFNNAKSASAPEHT